MEEAVEVMEVAVAMVGMEDTEVTVVVMEVAMDGPLTAVVAVAAGMDGGPIPFSDITATAICMSAPTNITTTTKIDAQSHT